MLSSVKHVLEDFNHKAQNRTCKQSFIGNWTPSFFTRSWIVQDIPSQRNAKQDYSLARYMLKEVNLDLKIFGWPKFVRLTSCKKYKSHTCEVASFKLEYSSHYSHLVDNFISSFKRNSKETTLTISILMSKYNFLISRTVTVGILYLSKRSDQKL